MLHKLCILLLVFCAFGNELLQIYILLYSKYEVTSSILLENLTSCFWNAYKREKKKLSYTNTSDFENLMFSIDVFVFKLRSICRLSRFMSLYSNSEVYVDSLDLCLYIQTQKYTWSRFCKLKYLFSNSKVYLKLPFET